MCKKFIYRAVLQNVNGLPDFVTDYQIRHLGNPSGLPEILPKIDPCSVSHSGTVFGVCDPIHS